MTRNYIAPIESFSVSLLNHCDYSMIYQGGRGGRRGRGGQGGRGSRGGRGGHGGRSSHGSQGGGHSDRGNFYYA